VELDEPSAVDYVNVFARSDVVTQNGPIRITLLGADGTSVVTSADTTLGGTDFNQNRYNVTQVFAGAPVASFVRIEALDTNLRLALAEVEVMGLAPAVVGLPGDFNGDDVVDAADYVVWRNALNSNDPGALGGNGNEIGTSQGVVDKDDYLLWKSQYGAVAPAALGVTVAAVPEPATGVALVLVVIGLGVAGRNLPGRCGSSP
jgi:hypothetical protein